MTELRKGAVLVEIHFGLCSHKKEFNFKTKFFVTFVFAQTSDFYHQVFPLSAHELKNFCHYDVIGKQLREYTTATSDNGFLVSYLFDDGSFLNIWGG
jgi:hypothetical protein